MNAKNILSGAKNKVTPAADPTEYSRPDFTLQTPQFVSVQCKLTVGSVDDPMEHEADAIADKVMRMPENTFIQRKCSHCEEEEKLHRKPILPLIQMMGDVGGSQVSKHTSDRIQSAIGNGFSMRATEKSFMESRIGADFSSVKIHTDNEAVQLSQELKAQAFTVRDDVFFNSGKYEPETSGGKQLLAHELVHTVQQTGASAIRKKTNPASSTQATGIDHVVNEVHEASDQWGTDEERIFRALQTLNRDPVQVNLASKKYEEKYGMTLEKQLDDEMSGSELRYGFELIGIVNKSGALITKIPETDAEYLEAAKRLKAAIHYGLLWGTDEETIYAVLLPFNKDSRKLRKLKQVYREIEGDVLRDDIIGDMSGKEEDYALYLLNDEVDETALEMDSMLGKRMQWRSSALFPCVNSVVTFNGKAQHNEDGTDMVCTTFADWATASRQGGVPGLVDGTIINCWEVILLAAYNAGAIDWGYIHDIYTDIPKCEISASQADGLSEQAIGKECQKQLDPFWKKKFTKGGLITYKPGTRPQRGDIVFFNGLAHVALATGSGSQIFTFWPAPMPKPWMANPNKAVVDVVKLSTIDELTDWWTRENKETPVVEFARPEW